MNNENLFFYGIFYIFFISYTKPKQGDLSGIKFVVPEKKEQKPECIHSEELYDKNHITIKEFLKQIN